MDLVTYVLIAFVGGTSVVAEFNDHQTCLMAKSRLSNAVGNQITALCTEKGQLGQAASLPEQRTRIIRVKPDRSAPDPYRAR